MNRELIHNAEQYHKRHRRKKAWHKVLGALGCVVVFCTTYALILPALTMEKELICPMQEHVHTQECYTALNEIVEQRLICTQEELAGHSHSASCFESESICGLTETEGHAHTDSCRGEAVLHCTLEESAAHAHELACFTGLEPVCGLAESEGHTHVETCRDESGVLICTLEELPSHAHELACFTGLEPVCGLVESEGHTHTDDCRTPGELICGLEELAPHSHTAACFDTPAVCGLEETEGHKHSEACYEILTTPVDAAALTCTLAQDENHSHSFLCYGMWEQTCTQEEHTHIDTCYVEKTTGDEAVDRVISLIDAMPTSEEIEAQLAAYEEAEDMESYESYYKAVGQQGLIAHNAYTGLTEAQQALVDNVDRLMASSWLWSRTTLDITQGIEIFQVNSCATANGPDTTLIRGKSAGDLNSAHTYYYWSAIVVEERSDGTLYVAEIDTTFCDKRSYSPQTANGFVLLIWDGKIPAESINISVGDAVSVNFDYTTAGNYTGTAYGTVTFANGTIKPNKNNSSKLDIVQGADTSDLIEVNLYDYGDNINDLYSSNGKYPGFQQDNGSTSVGSSFSKYMSFNFGNNITADLSAGLSNVTEKDGTTINATVGSYGGVDYGTANIPISGMILPTLKNGYPALADGTSLDYLFRTGTYAAKKNTASINGLFLHNEETGAYTFNSRENHAQFNAVNNTFTLYRQIISSNFMMYPFGNFLPFNDITKQSAQASTIDRAYLLEIANSAQYKANSGYNQTSNDEYGTLATQLKQFISLMDAKYGTDWDAYDAVNTYFSAAGLPASFSEGSPQLRPGEPLMDSIYSIDYDEETNFYFGMEMKMHFMQPKDGMTGTDANGNGVPDHPMVFYFTGDDDVWVYIDDTLFLDLSGIHRHVGGEIDFVNGRVNYYVLDPATGDVTGTPYKTVTFAEILGSTDGLSERGTFADYSSHSFNFYYMERGAGSGVCRMNFNFPLLRQNSITVSKEVAADAAIQGDPDYKFQVLKASDNGTKTDQLFIAADTPYTLYDKDGSILQEVVLTENPDGSIAGRRVVDGSGTPLPDSAVRKTDENGVFTLKAGQRAEFPGISENLGKYYVRELIGGTVLEQYDKVTVSGESTTTAGSVTIGSDTFTGMDSPVKDMSSGATAFRFTNDVDEQQLGSLSLTKKLTTLPGQTVAQTFDMTVTLSGTPLATGTPYRVDGEARTVATAGIISLAPGQTAVIDGLLAGTTYTVQETAASAKGYTVTYTVDGQTLTGHDSAAGTITPHSAVAVTISNSQKGITVDLPVEKTLQDNELGSVDRDFTFRLTPVVSAEDQTPIGESLTYTLTIPARTTEAVRADRAFSLTYAAVNMEQLPASFYYLLTEDAADNDPAVQYDDEAYVVCITISEDADGQLIADVTCTGSDGTTVSVPAFVNHLTYYALPETGGTGTHLYTMAGLMLLCSAAYLLYRQKRGKEAN